MKKRNLLASSIIGLCLIAGSSAQAVDCSSLSEATSGCYMADYHKCSDHYYQPVTPGATYVCKKNPGSTEICITSEKTCDK